MSQDSRPQAELTAIDVLKRDREAAKRLNDQRQIEQMRRKAQERLNKVARDGYKAKTRGQSINLNPYSKDTQPSLHAAWKAGFEYEPETEQTASETEGK